MLLCAVYSSEGDDVPVGEEVVCVCLPPEPLGGVSTVSGQVISVSVATHHSNPIAVEANVTPVRFDSNRAALEATPRYVCESTAGDGGLLNVLQILLV